MENINKDISYLSDNNVSSISHNDIYERYVKECRNYNKQNILKQKSLSPNYMLFKFCQLVYPDDVFLSDFIEHNTIDKLSLQKQDAIWKKIYENYDIDE